MAEPVRAALVGAGGFAGGRVVPMLKALDALRYVAVCDPDRSVAERAAGALGAEQVTDDYEAVLARDDVEMVDLHTPNYLHAPQAAAAFAAGKHVFVQKPMATGLAEGKAMVRGAREAGCRLGVFIDDLNELTLNDMKRAIDEGFIGTPTAFHLSFGRPGWRDLKPDSWRTSLKRTGGGSFIQLTVHNVREICWLLGARVRRVAGIMKTMLAKMEGDDSTAAALELDTGVVGTAASSYVLVSRPEVPTMVTAVWGTEGGLWKQRQGGLLRAFSTRSTFSGELLRYDAPGEAVTCTQGPDQLHRPTVHELFARSIRTGEPYPAPGEAGLHDLAVCLAIAESSRTGRAVDLDEFLGEA